MCASKIILSPIILAVLAYCNGEDVQFITEKPDDYDQKLVNFQPPYETIKRFVDESSCYPQDYDYRGNNCKLKCKVKTPYMIRIGNQEHLVPQKAEDGFIQSFKSVECAEERSVGHGPRNNCFKNIFTSRTTECKTSYTTIEMYTLDAKGKLGKIYLQVPSGCHCVVSDNLY